MVEGSIPSSPTKIIRDSYFLLYDYYMKPILFVDFDGTLCHDRFWRSINKDNFDKIQSYLFDRNRPLVNEWMRGDHPSEHINQLISKQLDLPFEKLWGIFVADCKSMAVSDDVLNQIKDLRSGFHTILITDNMDCFSRFTVPVLRLDSFFDSIINSSENKIFKKDNDGEIFLQITQEYGSKIESSILLDDSASTCSLFSKIGGGAHLVTPENSLSYWLELV